jgi:hypothetical protein
MGRVSILSVARLFASMLAAVIETTAGVWTLEGSSPFFYGGGAVRCSVTLSTMLRLLTIAAHDVLLDLTAVAACWNADVASSTRPFMAGSRTAVLPTSE